MAKNILRCDVTEYVIETDTNEIFVEFSLTEECLTIQITDNNGMLIKHTEIDRHDATQLANFILKQ